MRWTSHPGIVILPRRSEDEVLASRRNLTIKDIASMLGVSHSTVSRALSDSPLIGAATKERIRSAAAHHGYVPDTAARTMRGAPSAILGLLIPDVQTDFLSSLVKHFSTDCSDAGWNLLLSVSSGDPQIEERQIRAFREARVAGIAIYPTKHLTADSARLLQGVRTVQVGRCHAALAAPFISSDDDASAAALTQHLLDLGHGRIGFIGSDPSVYPGLPRWRGFRRALSAGLPKAAATGTTLRRIEAPTVEGGQRCMAELLALEHRPTAILVASAPMMPGVIEAAQSAGLEAPRDFAMAGFGDPAWFRVWGPGITTVALPIAGIAAAALRCLAAPSEDPAMPPGDEVLLPNTLVLRGTTRDAPSQPTAGVRTRRKD